jgi:hypothetical protein
MKDVEGSYSDLVERLRSKAPEYLNLLTAETDGEFEAAFDAILGKAIAHLEKNKKNFRGLDEEGLSAALAGTMSIPGLAVTQEANSNGHVDLTFEADHCSPPRIKLAEAKIYSGPDYHMRGLEQLLRRYTTGREGRGLLITYVRKENISGLIQKLQIRMDEELPQNQRGNTKPYIFKWSFLSTHGHSCGEDREVSHIGCNLYVE